MVTNVLAHGRFTFWFPVMDYLANNLSIQENLNLKAAYESIQKGIKVGNV